VRQHRRAADSEPFRDVFDEVAGSVGSEKVLDLTRLQAPLCRAASIVVQRSPGRFPYQ